MSDERTSFFQSALCRGRRHCRDCRQSAAYRQGIAARFLVPSLDFACPHGITTESLPASSFPPVWEQAEGFMRGLGALARRSLTSGRLATVSEEERQQRLEICHACPDYVSRFSRCKRCGCALSFKTHLETAHCPIGNW